MSGKEDPRRRLPGVDRLLEREEASAWSRRWGREAVASALRETLEAARLRLGRDGEATVPDAERLLEEAEERLERAARPSLRPVLNATGVVLHTNLGRAPLAEEALEAAREVGKGYSNLEYDLDSGERGSRQGHAAGLLCELTGAEAALVVNNNAAAVSLAVNELAAGREVLVSRGEMVEIGGSFRIPDVVRRSGATLRGVGTTNRTRLSDYREALGPSAGMILKVHPSNYQVEGFTERTPLPELVALGREADVPVVHDLGSGLLRPELLEGFPPEPSPGDALRAGADLVTWSGDKLLGGPQAGVIVGGEEIVARLAGNPLLRAFRPDKSLLAALEATLRLYRDPEGALERIPALRLLTEPVESVERRAGRALETADLPASARVEVRRMQAVVGGGAYPDHRIPSAGWSVTGPSPDRLDTECRAARPPLVGRIREGEYLLDFRTLLADQGSEAARVLKEALGRLEA